MKMLISTLTGLLLAAGVMGCFSANAAAIAITTHELPRAAVKTPYSVSIRTVVTSRCPVSDVSLSLESGALPPGMELGLEGVAGVARKLGLYKFTLRAANGCGETSRSYSLLVTGKPILEVSPEQLAFVYRIGGPQPPSRMILVSGSWPDLPYSVTQATPEWLSVRPADGTTPSEGAARTADPIEVAVRTEGLKPGIHNAELRVWTAAGANVEKIPITLTVLAAK